MNLISAVLKLFSIDDAIVLDLLFSYRLNSYYRSLVIIEGVYHLAGAGFFSFVRYGYGVAEKNCKRLTITVPLRMKYGISQSLLLLLANVVDIDHIGEVLGLLIERLVALLLQIPFKLEAGVEVILDGPLAPTGYYQNILYARKNSLLYNILNHRFINHRQHLLRLGLGQRQESCAQSCRGYHSPFYLRLYHRITFITPLPYY